MIVRLESSEIRVSNAMLSEAWQHLEENVNVFVLKILQPAFVNFRGKSLSD